MQEYLRWAVILPDNLNTTKRNIFLSRRKKGLLNCFFGCKASGEVHFRHGTLSAPFHFTLCVNVMVKSSSVLLGKLANPGDLYNIGAQFALRLHSVNQQYQQSRKYLPRPSQHLIPRCQRCPRSAQILYGFPADELPPYHARANLLP